MSQHCPLLREYGLSSCVPLWAPSLVPGRGQVLGLHEGAPARGILGGNQTQSPAANSHSHWLGLDLPPGDLTRACGVCVPVPYFKAVPAFPVWAID